MNSAPSRSPGERRSRIGLFLAVMVLFAALLFGGGARRDLISDYVPQFLSLILLWRLGPVALSRLGEDRFVGAFLAAVVLIPILYVVPLPEFIVAMSPGRSAMVAPLQVMGLEPSWAPLSTRPYETLNSALSLLPAIALFAAALVLSARERRLLVLVALCIGLLSVPLGMMQVLGGQESPLYFYAITNNERAVGFFANANHFAAFFYILTPFCVAFAASDRKVGGVALAHVGLIALGVLLLGLVLSGSRSALVLGPLSLLASYAWFGRSMMTFAFGSKFKTLGVFALAFILAPIALGVGLLTTLGRLETQDVAEDLRWTLSLVTWAAALDMLPFGSGLGSFERTYAFFEPIQAVVHQVVNHAHNDWVELFLELGLFGVFFAVLAVAWVVKAAIRERGDWEQLDERLARAGVIAVVMVMLHSFVDYPARTIAISSLLALSVGLTFAPRAGSGEFQIGFRRRRKRGKTRRMTAMPVEIRISGRPGDA